MSYKVQKNYHILDFGCGDGSGVRYLREKGFTQTFGCDFGEQENRYCLSIVKPYQLPFEDNYFDFIYSSQVFEHIQSYPLALGELARVIKPQGFCLHIFPPKWRWIEAHVFVPLAGVFQNKFWLSLWANLGVKNQFQSDKTPQEITQLNYDYLHQYTNYLTRKEIQNLSSQYFQTVNFCETTWVRCSRYRHLYPLFKYGLFLSDYLGNFHMTSLFLAHKLTKD